MEQGALSGVDVIDLTHHVAGPYCTKLLAGFGANVMKIERPESGDPMRSRGPFLPGAPDHEGSLPFHWLNTGKKSVVLNLKSEAGRRALEAMVRQANVVVENFAPRVMPGLGLEYESLRKHNPRLVMTSISNFGQTGPYRDYRADEMTLQALGGLMDRTGDPDREPLRAGPLVAQYAAGMVAYVATLIAVVAGPSDQGQHIDISIQEAALDNIEIGLVEYLRSGRRTTRRGDRHTFVPWELAPCRDGHAAIIGGPVRRWRAAASLFEAPELQDGKYAHMRSRIEHREEIWRLINSWLERTDKRTIYQRGQASGLAFGYLAGLDEVLRSAQLRSRGFFETVNHPAGPLLYGNSPFRLSRTPWRTGRAPLLGEHTREVLQRYLGDEVESLAQPAGVPQ